MYPYFSQRDRRWRIKPRFSDAKLTIGNYGCLITAVAALRSWYGEYTTPGNMSHKLRYTKNGLLYWTSIPAPMKFVYRYYYFNSNKAYSILKSRDNACILEVQWGKQKHWVVLVGWRKNEPIIHDTWDGKRKRWSKTQFSRITGMAEVTRA